MSILHRPSHQVHIAALSLTFWVSPFIHGRARRRKMKRSYIKSIRCLFLGYVFLLAGSSLAMADGLEEGEPQLSCERLDVICAQDPTDSRSEEHTSELQ